jgi:hypothetical protein
MVAELASNAELHALHKKLLAESTQTVFGVLLGESDDED